VDVTSSSTAGEQDIVQSQLAPARTPICKQGRAFCSATCNAHLLPCLKLLVGLPCGRRLPAGATQEVCRVLSSRQQAEIYWQAQSAWYVTLICSQFWHIWVCKTRVVSVQGPFF
jgi:hypothetical protein